MAVVATNAGAAVETGLGPRTISVTADGSQYVLFLAVSYASGYPADDIAVSGLGLTWEKKATGTYSYRRRFWVYTGRGTSSGSDITVEYDPNSLYGAEQEYGWALVKVTGADTTEMIRGTIGTYGVDAGGGGTTNRTAAATASVVAGDAALAFCATESDTVDVLPDSNYVELASTGQGNNYQGIRQVTSSWDADAGDLSATWDKQGGSTWVGLATLVVAGDSGTVPPDPNRIPDAQWRLGGPEIYGDGPFNNRTAVYEDDRVDITDGVITLTADAEGGLPGGATISSGAVKWGFENEAEASGTPIAMGSTVEADVKFPLVGGTFAAFWMIPSDNAREMPEIDMAEQSYTSDTSDRNFNAIVWTANPNAAANVVDDRVAVTPDDQWHTVRIELDWGETRIYHDDVLVNSSFTYDPDMTWGLMFNFDMWSIGGGVDTGSLPTTCQMRNCVVTPNAWTKPDTYILHARTQFETDTATSYTTDNFTADNTKNHIMFVYHTNETVTPTVTTASQTWTNRGTVLDNDGVRRLTVFEHTAGTIPANSAQTVDFGVADPTGVAITVVETSLTPSSWATDSTGTDVTSLTMTPGGTAGQKVLTAFGVPRFRGSPESEAGEPELDGTQSLVAWHGGTAPLMTLLSGIRDSADTDVSASHTNNLPWVGATVLLDSPSSPLTAQFGGGSLPAGWTFEQNSAANAVNTNTGSSTKIQIPAGTASDNIYSPATTDNTAGILHDLPTGSFDIAIRVATAIGGDNSSGFGFNLIGADSTDMIRWGLYSTDDFTYKYGYARQGPSGTGVSTEFQAANAWQDGVWLRNHPSWLRVAYDGVDTFTFYLSGDGNTWVTESTHTSALHAPETLKFFVQQGYDLLGRTIRIDECVDLGDIGGTDARGAAPTYYQGTTETSDLTSTPAWLTTEADGTGSSAVQSGSVMTLTTGTATDSSARLVYNGAAAYTNAGVLVSATAPNDGFVQDCYYVIGLAANDAGADIDVYSKYPSYLLEIDAESGAQVAVRSVRPVAPITNLNESYVLLEAQETPANVSGTTKTWTRMEKYGTRLRVRRWSDADSEPSTWDYDGEEDVLRGVGNLEPYIAIAHNPTPGIGQPQTLQIDDIEFYELTDTAPTGVNSYVGDTEASALYVGSSAVTAIHLGSSQIWP